MKMTLSLGTSKRLFKKLRWDSRALLCSRTARVTFGHSNINELKGTIQFLRHKSHISSTQWPHVASGYCIGQYRQRILSPLQGVLTDSTALEDPGFEEAIPDQIIWMRAVQHLEHFCSSSLEIVLRALRSHAKKTSYFIYSEHIKCLLNSTPQGFKEKLDMPFPLYAMTYWENKILRCKIIGI